MEIQCLPPELLEKILSHLPDPITVLRAEKVCTQWSLLIKRLVEKGRLSRTLPTDWGELADMDPTPAYNPIQMIAHSSKKYCLKKSVHAEVKAYKKMNTCLRKLHINQ